MSINGNRQNITKEDLLEVARKFNIKEAASMIEKAKSTVKKYRRYAIMAGIEETWIRKIEEEIDSRIKNL